LRKSTDHEKMNCIQLLLLLSDDSYVRVTRALLKYWEADLEMSAAAILHTLDDLEPALG